MLRVFAVAVLGTTLPSAVDIVGVAIFMVVAAATPLMNFGPVELATATVRFASSVLPS